MKIASSFLAAALLALLRPTPSNAIQGGTPVAQGDPLTGTTVEVLIRFIDPQGDPSVACDSSDVNPCGGTIYAPDLVVTAAHCVKAYSAFQLAFGLNPYDPRVEKRNVTAFEIPMDYVYTGGMAKTAHADIALLYFEGGLPAGYHAARFADQSVKLPDQTVIHAADFGPCRSASTCALTGWKTVIGSQSRLPDDLSLSISGPIFPVKGDSGGPAYLSTPQGPLVVGLDHGEVGNELYTNIANFDGWLGAAA